MEFVPFVIFKKTDFSASRPLNKSALILRKHQNRAVKAHARRHRRFAVSPVRHLRLSFFEKFQFFRFSPCKFNFEDPTTCLCVHFQVDASVCRMNFYMRQHGGPVEDVRI